MKNNLQEELKRLLRLSYYGNDLIAENTHKLESLMGRVRLNEQEKVDDPKKADLVKDDVADFYKTLEDSAESGGLSQQQKGQMNYQKSVESLQIGLMILGYDLPKHGVDGLFGPETASAVKKFEQDNLKSGTSINESVKLVSAGGNNLGKPGQGTHNASDWQSRNAWDVSGPVGTEVYSISSGTVARLRKGTGKLIRSGVKKIYGDQLTVKSDDGKPDVFYTHIDSSLSVGDKVKVGDLIGKMVDMQGIPSHVHIGLSSGNLADYTDLKWATGGESGGDSGVSVEEQVKASPDLIKKMIEMLKEKNVTSEQIKRYIDESAAKRAGGVNISLSGDWVDITKSLLRKHEGFLATAKWDENAFRGGYGTDKKMVNGRLENATRDTTWTRQEAEDTMDYEIKNQYGPIVAKQLGNDNWNKLNDRQKAALVSLGYNAGPYFISVRDYGKAIKKAIEDGDMQKAAEYIASGPTKGSVSGKYYSGLEKRRKEESDVFLS